MDLVSLTYFVDFVLKSGTSKLTGVREYKGRRDELCSDFYRPIREAIVEMHKKGLSLSTLEDVTRAQEGDTRKKHYPLVIEGYRRFLAEGPKNFFEPPRSALSLGALSLDVNPELGLLIDGKPHMIKLYFRSEPLDRKRSALVLSLLARGLSEKNPEMVPAILEVRTGKLHTHATPNPRMELLLRGEAASFAAMYEAA